MRDDLLNPIPGDNPGGENLWYDPVYDKIKEARREEDDAPQGEWQYDRKVADWKSVVKMAGDAIATRSKDLQLAAWLTEAMLHMEGYGGLRDGIGLTRGLLENFWDHLYPEIEEGDAELRVAPLDWMGSRLNRTFQLLPITKTGLNWFDYKQAHGVGHESDADTDTKRENYQKAIQEGKVTGEMWDDAFKATSKDYYKNAVQTLDSLLENIEALKTVCNEKFQDSGPSFSPLQAAVEEVRHTVKGLWMEKRKLDPDPEDLQAAGEAAPGEVVAGEKPTGAQPARSGGWGMGWDDDGTSDAQAFELASMTARSGNMQEALRILTGALLNEKYGRRRFLRKTQIAQICVESGKEDIALPILEELQAEIDARKLEEWESHDVIARPLALLYRCQVKLERDFDERNKLYARVCRLSPFEAFGCNK